MFLYALAWVPGLSASVSAGRVGNNDGFADFAAAFNGGMSPPSVAPIHINSSKKNFRRYCRCVLLIYFY